jgi:hypothetical protein
MDAKKIAEATPESERLSKTEDYLTQAANNQKKAAQELSEQLSKVDGIFSDVLQNAPREDFKQVYGVINQVNKLLNDVKAGKDPESIIKQLKNIK